jgi:hypothetical protein
MWKLEPTKSAGCYVVSGYPVQTTARDLEAGTICSTPVSYASFPFDGQLDDHVERVTIALHYHAGHTMDENWKHSRPPHLGGISGGGIWHLFTDDAALARWKPSDVKLVGIEHGFVENRAIKGSHVAFLVTCIQAAYPELSASIALHRQ